MFLISEGKGKTRSTKNGGLSRENSWNNVVITNGEKDIIKSKSEKAEKYRELQQMYIKYQEETDAQLAALEEKIDEILNKGKEEMSYED